MHGKKLYLKCNKIKVIKEPMYEGLRVKDLLKFAKTKWSIDEYLPDYVYSKEPNKEWLCNIINTLIPEDFYQFV